MKNKPFDPESYTISVKKTVEDGETFFVARVSEIPDITEYADSPEFARELALDSIITSFEMCTEQGIEFPYPSEDNQHCNASGRVTLRLPKQLHYKCIKNADYDGVSLNSYLTMCITSYVHETSTNNRILNEISEIKNIIGSQPKNRSLTNLPISRNGYYWHASSEIPAKLEESSSRIDSFDYIDISLIQNH
ncbi:TPA: toxin-antitoxin system HicB family antitoxin [Providencia alcalifaciens]